MRARYCTVTTTSVMSWRLSSRRMCSITGRLTIGTMGLGRPTVKGRRREPSPPAMTTAFICAPPPAVGYQPSAVSHEELTADGYRVLPSVNILAHLRLWQNGYQPHGCDW